MIKERTETPSESMDSLVARREARRRKILENAESRLKKLTGVEHKSDVTIDGLSPVEYGNHGMSHNVTSVTTSHYTDFHQLSERFVPPISQLLNSNLSVPSELSESNLNQERTIQRGSYKLHTLIAIAFVSNILSLFSTIVYNDTETNVAANMIFMPLLGYKLIEHYLNRGNIPEKSFLQLFIMANLKNDILKRAIIYFQYLGNFTQDLFVYFFLFVAINQVFQITLIFR